MSEKAKCQYVRLGAVTKAKSQLERCFAE